MTRPAILTRAAQRDLRGEVLWIGPDNLAKLRALKAAVQRAAQRLGDRPQLGRQHTALPARYRIWSLTRFQLLLIYDAETDPPRVIRVLSTARDLTPLLASIAGQG